MIPSCPVFAGDTWTQWTRRAQLDGGSPVDAAAWKLFLPLYQRVPESGVPKSYSKCLEQEGELRNISI